MINEVVWPVLSDHPRITELFWQQDGAPAHSSNVVLASLREKFPGRVISRKGDIVWPACSPDINPLDFFIWGFAKTFVFNRRPETLD